MVLLETIYHHVGSGVKKAKVNSRISSKVEEELKESEAHNESGFAERVEISCEDTDWII